MAWVLFFRLLPPLFRLYLCRFNTRCSRLMAYEIKDNSRRAAAREMIWRVCFKIGLKNFRQKNKYYKRPNVTLIYPPKSFFCCTSL